VPFIKRLERWLAYQADNNGLYYTDTTPQNIEYVGVLAQLFPRARWVFCDRALPDLALQNYFRHFGGDLAFNHRFEDIFQYRESIKKLMSFWRERFNLEVSYVAYEKLLQDPLTVINGLLTELDLSLFGHEELGFLRGREKQSSQPYLSYMPDYFSNALLAPKLWT
jgi:hypothetical protein